MSWYWLFASTNIVSYENEYCTLLYYLCRQNRTLMSSTESVRSEHKYVTGSKEKEREENNKSVITTALGTSNTT